MTCVLVDLSVASRHRNLRSPWPDPGRGIIRSELVEQIVGVNPPETLSEVESLCRASEVRLVAEIRRLDDERIAVPSPPAVAEPLAKAGREVRSAIERDYADLVNHLVQDDDLVRGLENLQVRIVRARQTRHRPVNDAAFPQSSIEPRIGAAPAGRHMTHRGTQRL